MKRSPEKRAADDAVILAMTCSDRTDAEIAHTLCLHKNTIQLSRMRLGLVKKRGRKETSK